MKRTLQNAVLALACFGAVVAAGYGLLRFWPDRVQLEPSMGGPRVWFADGRVVLEPRGGVVAGQVARFRDELTAYLHFQHLRTRLAGRGWQLRLAASETGEGPVYRIVMLLPPDLVQAVPLLEELRARRSVPESSLWLPDAVQLRNLEQQTALFVAAYNQPARRRLEELGEERLLPSMARFMRFKSVTDPRIRNRMEPAPQPLSLGQAHQFAADIIAVAQFYDLPLDYLLGIGAMENNYMSMIGDWAHTRWKPRAQPGDIVVARRKGRVLVWNYSVGVWQITRETLRRAHAMYRRDRRDYASLPERLRPPRELNLDAVDEHVLTTYAGVLLRNLLDHFGGDLEKAVGAYNGGIAKPNLKYASAVARIAEHARQVLEQSAARAEGKPAPTGAPASSLTAAVAVAAAP